MTQATEKIVLPSPFPDHTQLPEEDGTFVKNFQEHPQSIILTDSIGSVLQGLHPDGQYAIGQDCGIYWRETDPLEKGAEAPDWFYVPNVPPTLGNQIRRSYVLWREFMAPMIAWSSHQEMVQKSGTQPHYRTQKSERRKDLGSFGYMSGSCGFRFMASMRSIVAGWRFTT